MAKRDDSTTRTNVAVDPSVGATVTPRGNPPARQAKLWAVKTALTSLIEAVKQLGEGQLADALEEWNLGKPTFDALVDVLHGVEETEYEDNVLEMAKSQDDPDSMIAELFPEDKDQLLDRMLHIFAASPAFHAVWGGDKTVTKPPVDNLTDTFYDLAYWCVGEDLHEAFDDVDVEPEQPADEQEEEE